MEKKKELKCIGIWMDHASAHLMEYSKGDMVTNTIASSFTHEVKEETFAKSESSMHNKEHQQHLSYYKKIADAIKSYDSVLLFGPTSAKSELHNVLKADHHFDEKIVEVKQADKMTDHQQHAFVKEYFS